MQTHEKNPAGWRAMAVLEDFGRSIDVTVAREVGREFEVVIGADPTGTTLTRQAYDQGIRLPAGLKFDVFMAEEIYKALDRLFGHENRDGAVETLKASLAKEQSRVDKMLDVVLSPQSTIAYRQPRTS